MNSKLIFRHVLFSKDNGAGAETENEGNLGAEDIFGYDEKDNED